jgi:predicted NAD-dependent protein-ADP-ribosyltransferase YbiA (DUF1768 family)
MVLSKINESIEYPDIKTVDMNDVGYDANLYELELMPGVKAIIALGKVKYTNAEKNVLYIPVYLVDDDEISIQIGVYEFLSQNYESLLDEDNDFDISRLNSDIPLFYRFVTKKLLLENGGQLENGESVSKADSKVNEITRDIAALNLSDRESDEDEQDEQDDIEGEDDGEDDIEMEEKSESVMSNVESKENSNNLEFEDDDDIIPAIDETMNEDMQQRRNFKKKRSNNWIQNYMKNSLYGIIDNEGGGDCLFATIRDGLSGIDINTTVEKLRNIISEKADETVYQNFKEQYDMFKAVAMNSTISMSTLKEDIETLKQEKKKTKDRKKQKEIVKLAKLKLKEFKIAKMENIYAEELFSDYRWMDGVDNLEKFKSKLRSCDFWAEAWAINTLEYALNIKLIILSSENYRKKDLANVLRCDSGFVDDKIREKGSFKPKHYIVVEYTGNHYKLITYKGKKIFNFKNIPYSLKMLIVEKCMEKMGGIFSYIPKFVAFKNQLDGDADDTDDHDEQSDNEGKENKSSEKIEEKTTNVIEDKREEQHKEKMSDLYDPNIVFQFYSKSNSKPLPGKGAGEKIPKEDIMKFSDLASMKDWRKELSNFSVSPFVLDGHRWKGVEWYYQASKFKKGFPEFYLKFSLDSKSEISEDPVLAKAAGGKTGKFRGKRIRGKHIVMDSDFFGKEGRNSEEMKRAQEAKYKQNERARDVLLATKNAKLVHYTRGSPPIVFTETMEIRRDLMNEQRSESKE